MFEHHLHPMKSDGLPVGEIDPIRRKTSSRPSASYDLRVAETHLHMWSNSCTDFRDFRPVDVIDRTQTDREELAIWQWDDVLNDGHELGEQVPGSQCKVVPAGFSGELTCCEVFAMLTIQVEEVWEFESRCNVRTVVGWNVTGEYVGANHVEEFWWQRMDARSEFVHVCLFVCWKILDDMRGFGLEKGQARRTTHCLNRL